MIIKVLLVVRGDSFPSDSNYILMESNCILLESDCILLESDYILLETKNMQFFMKISNQVQCDSINSSNVSHASAYIHHRYSTLHNHFNGWL